MLLMTFTQLTVRLKNFLRSRLLVLDLEESLVEYATACVKSEFILTKSDLLGYILFCWFATVTIVNRPDGKLVSQTFMLLRKFECQICKLIFVEALECTYRNRKSYLFLHSFHSRLWYERDRFFCSFAKWSLKYGFGSYCRGR